MVSKIVTYVSVVVRAATFSDSDVTGHDYAGRLIDDGTRSDV